MHGTGKIDAVSPYFVPAHPAGHRLRLPCAGACCLARSPHSTAGTAAFSPAFSPALISVVMICVARWRAMLRDTPDAQRRLEEACRRECDEREQFLWQKSAPRGCVGALWRCFARRCCGPIFFRAAGLALMGAACVPPSDKQSAFTLRFQTGISARPWCAMGRRAEPGLPGTRRPRFHRQRRRFDSAL